MDLAGFAGALASPAVPPGESWRPVRVKLAAGQKNRFVALCQDRGIRVSDTIDRQLAELAAARFPGPRRERERSRFTAQLAASVADLAEAGLWVYLPWAAQAAHLLAPREYLEVVTNRNRDKITRAEQDLLRTKRVGVLGLSVGAEAAVAIAQEHLCGHLVLADFDRLDLSNLNRLGASFSDIGQPKTKIAARRIAAIDPYLEVTLVECEVTAANVGPFVDGLDLLVEECDGPAAKYAVRMAAQASGVNVVYAADERGFLSVEPYGTRPGLPPFHGLVGSAVAASGDHLTALVQWLGGPPHCRAVPGTPSHGSEQSLPGIHSSPARRATPPRRSGMWHGGCCWAKTFRRFTATSTWRISSRLCRPATCGAEESSNAGPLARMGRNRDRRPGATVIIDGYREALIGISERAILVALIGADAEALVYLYGSCDRAAVYPRLGDDGPVVFPDRFTCQVSTPAEHHLRAFAELTAANEFDVICHNPALAAEHGLDLLDLITRVRDRLSGPAWRAWAELGLGAPAAARQGR